MSRIRKVASSGLVEIVWSTSWCGDTDLLEDTFKLPHFESAWKVPPEGNYVGDLKWNAAKAVIDRGDRLIWTDDTEVPSPGNFYYDYLTKDDRALLIAPTEKSGLRPQHMRAIEEFIGLKDE